MSEHADLIQNEICELCEEESVTTSIVNSTFEYNLEGKVVELEAALPVHSCNSCGIEYTSSVAEDIKHEAICDYLEVLTPREIRSLRTVYKMSRVDFAKASGVGSASLSRWESGSKIQNRANDNLLRLLTDEQNMDRLLSKESKTSTSTSTDHPIFRVLEITSSILNDSSAFRLRY